MPPESSPPSVVEEPPLELPEERSGKKSGKGALPAGVLLLLLLMGGAVWWFALRTPEKPPLPPVPATEQSRTPPAASATRSPLAAAREQLRGDARPEISLSLAKPMRKDDAGAEESDAAFLLLEDAAQKGTAEAMLLVGQFYDPLCPLPRGSIPVDMSQAKHWYDQAAQKGLAEAVKALDALHAHVRDKAARGDSEAQTLLNNWK